MPFMDRSSFLDELKRNPALMTRLNTIVNGEIGHKAPMADRILYLETIFNRAQARGQSLAEVTRSVDGRYNADGSGRGGYYPPETFRYGAPRSQGEQNQFNEQVLKPVLSGSDESTRRLGFAATGNASAGVAQRGVTSGRYTAHANIGGSGVTGAPGVETYVQEGRIDNIPRLHGFRVGERPTPPADIPNPGGDVFDRGAAPMNPLTGMRTPGNIDPNSRPVVKNADGTISTMRSASGNIDGVETLVPTITPEGKQQSVSDALATAAKTGQNLGTFYAPEAATNFAVAQHVKQDDRYSPAPASGVRAPSAPSLGSAFAKALGFPGSRDDLPYDYVDPNTGHRIVNPTGSGELAMGLTRDFGRPQAQAGRPQAPVPQRPASTLTPTQRGAASVESPRGPVPPTPRPTEKIAPFPDTGGVTIDEMQRRPLMPLDPAAVVAQPTQPNSTVFDVKQTKDVVPPGLDLFPRQRAPQTMGAFPTAPELAGLLAPEPTPTPKPVPDASVAFRSGGSAMPLPYQPTTVRQQDMGMSPFTARAPQVAEFTVPPRQMQADLSPFNITPQQSGFASTTLLPFDQWPPIGFGWAGPSFDFNAWG